MLCESERLEFKEILTDGIYKEVIAFANTNGGTILIGINTEGECIPVAEVDDTYTRITNGVRDAISPDVTVFVKYTLEADKTIRVEVNEGASKPYYLKSKGLKPSGVYIRQGTSSVPASLDQIRQMIKIADGDVFEDLRSLKQDLTFRSCADIFEKCGVEFGEGKYNALGIRNHSQGLFTNLGLILSDQCEHTVKVAVFADGQNTIFKARKEFAGSVFAQMEETFSYLQLCNQNRSVIDGLVRADYWDYPKDAIREALLNALVHRDYSFSGSIIINVNDKCMEFISIGGLPPGISPEDIRNGISQPRNRKLAEVFHRLNFIESYGTGIRRIFAPYQNSAMMPGIEVTGNSFKIILPNMNAGEDIKVVQKKVDTVTSSQMQAVLDFLVVHEQISDGELMDLLGVKRTRCYVLMKQMMDLGLIEVVGRGAGKKFRLV